VDAAQLPLNKSLADAYLSVSKTGKLEMGMSVGDSDASADSSLQLPLKSGEIAPIDSLLWTASGGDHASGMWSFNCITEISVK
jgi:hypothetical protein